ncbi:TPA: hypothetical protein KKX44_002858 [Legionella pneumophila]|nr:hypothetical protein [Legionella pneumophila]
MLRIAKRMEQDAVYLIRFDRKQTVFANLPSPLFKHGITDPDGRVFTLCRFASIQLTEPCEQLTARTYLLIPKPLGKIIRDKILIAVAPPDRKATLKRTNCQCRLKIDPFAR